MRDQKTAIRVGGLFISVSLAVIFALADHQALAIAIALGLLGAVITLLLDLALSFAEFENSLTKTYQGLQTSLLQTRDAVTEELARSLALSASIVANAHDAGNLGAIVESIRHLEQAGSDDLFVEEGRREMLRCASVLKRLADGDLVLEEVHRMEKMIALLDAAAPGEAVRATSYVGLDEWWRTGVGSQYLEANFRACQRGVSITRIFILKADEILPFRPFIEAHQAGGVTVLIAKQETLDDKYKENFFLLGDRIVSYTEYSREGRLVAGHVMRNFDTAKQYAARFRALAMLSLPAVAVYPT